jgi:hypothetical protein
MGQHVYSWRVIAESLDAMFDVFGEDHLDPIVREIQMVERLKSLLPKHGI